MTKLGSGDIAVIITLVDEYHVNVPTERVAADIRAKCARWTQKMPDDTAAKLTEQAVDVAERRHEANRGTYKRVTFAAIW